MRRVPARLPLAMTPVLRCASTRPFDFVTHMGPRLSESVQTGEGLTVHLDSHSFAWLVMNAPNSSGNALNSAMGDALVGAFKVTDQWVKEGKASVALLTSAKETFCVGADVDQLYPLVGEEGRLKGKELSTYAQKLLEELEGKPYPTVAALNGLALGGGCELALACTHRVMADTAAMGLPECLLGVLPGAGGTVRLPRQIGLANALRWVLTGAATKADRCKREGACDAVIPAEDRFVGEGRFVEGVRSYAGRLVERPVRPAGRKPRSWAEWALECTPMGRWVVHRKALEGLDEKTKGKYIGHYYAVESIMSAYPAVCHWDPKRKPSEKSLSAAYDRESTLFSRALITPESKNLFSLYFLERGMKDIERKTGLAKAAIPSLNHAGVIGAGVMGSGIVHFFAQKGIPVAVKDMTTEAVTKGLGFVRAEFERSVKRKRMTNEQLEKKMALVTSGINNDVFAGCDVIVEAAVEQMSVKKVLLKELEDAGVLNEKTIFATNTSSLSLTELQASAKYPDKIVGMHFFNPVSKMPLVEVIKGAKTSPESVAAIYQLALRTGKKPIIVGDGPGFLVNRILGVYMAEASRLVFQERADPAEVDRVMVDFGMPMGPFRLIDEVGLDVGCHVGPVLEKGLRHSRFAVNPKLNEMVKDGLLGKKNGRGLYRYENGKEKGLNLETIRKYVGTAFARVPAADILDRCVLLMVNEAAHILAEKIAASAEDVDIGMVWGTGFPPFRGGLLQYADHRGLPEIVARLNALQTALRDDRFAPAPLLATMAAERRRFFPNRPFVPYVERTGRPQV